ncbi:MAG: hypothetical protein ACP5KP_04590, partial [Candidatus Micrarchaeia archaeon]
CRYGYWDSKQQIVVWSSWENYATGRTFVMQGYEALDPNVYGYEYNVPVYYQCRNVFGESNIVSDTINFDDEKPSGMSTFDPLIKIYPCYINFSWPNSLDGGSGMNVYEISRWDNESDAWTFIVNQSATAKREYIDSSVAPGVVYRYQAVPYDVAGNAGMAWYSYYTNDSDVEKPQPAPMRDPLIINSTGGTNIIVDTWQSTVNLSSYFDASTQVACECRVGNVKLAIPESIKWGAWVPAPSNPLVINNWMLTLYTNIGPLGLECEEGPAKVAAQCRNLGGESEIRYDDIKVDVVGPKFIIPYREAVYDDVLGVVNVTFFAAYDCASSVDFYRIERSQNGGPWINIYDWHAGDSMPYQDSSISGGNTYKYRISAYDIYSHRGQSLETNEVSVSKKYIKIPGESVVPQEAGSSSKKKSIKLPPPEQVDPNQAGSGQKK